jgi:hypothetical protein
MESRLPKYKQKHVKRMKRTPVIGGLAVAYLGATLFFQSIPVTYAWFTASSISKGHIQNATTAELISMNPEVIEYVENGIVKLQISITNISTVSIPLRIELLSNNEVIQSSSNDLKHNGTFSTNLEEFEALTDKGELRNLQYRIVGFEGYVDEIITVQVDEEKVKSTIKQETEEIKEVPDRNKDTQDSTEAENQAEQEIDAVNENPVEEVEEQVEEQEVKEPAELIPSENNGDKDVSSFDTTPESIDTTPKTVSNEVPLIVETVN